MKNPSTGEIATLVSAFDWAQTPLGAAETWSSELKAAVELLLTESDRAKTSTDNLNSSLYNSQQRYETLLKLMDRGFSIAEMIFDAEGRPVDYRFLEVNSLFEEMTGLTGVIGKTVLELVPDLEDFWMETYGRVVLTGESVQFEHEAKALNRWYEVNAFPIDAPREFRFGVIFTDITDRRYAQIRLRLIQERFEISIAAGDVGVWDLDLVSMEAWRSIEHDRIFGYEELLPDWNHERFLSHVIPEDRDRIDREIKEAIANHTSFQMEYRIRTINGDLRWIWSKACTEYNQNDEPVRMYGVVRDINDRKQQEQNNNFLVEIQKDLAMIEDIDQIMDVVGEKIRLWFDFSIFIFADIDVAADEARTIYSSNDSDVPNAVGRHLLSEYYSDIHLQQLKAGQTVAISDVRTEPNLKDNGSAYESWQVLSSVSVPYISDGQWKFLMGGYRRVLSVWREDELELMGELILRIYLEIVRMRAELQISKNEERLRLAIEGTNMGTWDLDLQTQKLVWSEQNFRLLGYEPSSTGEANHEMMANCIYPDDKELVNLRWQKSLQEQSQFHSEHRIIRFDNQQTIWVEDLGSFIYDHNGQAIRATGVVFDISDRKRQELNNNFLDEIQKDLIILSDPTEIMSVVGEKIRQRFDFAILTFSDISATYESRTFYNNHDGNLLHVEAPPTHYLPNFLSETHLEKLNAGQVVAIDDVRNNPDLKDGGMVYQGFQVCSLVNVPYLSNSQWKFLLGGNRRQLSNWHQDELELLSELTERLCLRIDRARAEITFQEVNRRFETVLQSVNGIIFEWEVSRDIVYRSEGLLQLVGIRTKDAEPTKQWWIDRVHPEDIPQIEATFANFSDSKINRYQSEYRIRHKDGRWIDVWEQGNIERNAEGEIIKLVGFTSDISDRKYAERRLRESERIYRAIGETLDYGIWINDPNGHNIYTSPSFLGLLGITQAECAGLDWGKYLHPDHCDRTVREWLECVRTEGNWDVELRYLGVDGNYHPILARGVPVRGDRGEIIYWAGINLDISELKQAEQLLRQSEERLQLTIEGTQIATWDTDLISGKSIWSKRHFTMLGYEPIETGEATYQMWECLIHPDDRERVQQEWQQSQQEHSIYRCEHRVCRADNNQIAWLSATGSFTYDANGRAIRSLGVVLDVSDRKLTEEALYLSRQRMDLVLNSVELGLWYCNLPFDRLEWNDTCKQHFGLPPETIVTIDLFYEHIHPSDRLRVEQTISESIENQLDYDIDYRTVGLDGQERWIRAIGRGFYDATGTPIRFDGVTVNITELKRNESALKQSEERYRNLIELIPQLIWKADDEGKVILDVQVFKLWLDT